MQECQPIPTLRAFLDGPLEYVLPAPGGAVADGGCRTNEESDLYLAALAAKAKRRAGDRRSPLEYLQMHYEIVRTSPSGLFGEQQDAMIVERVGAWIRELVS